MLYHSTRGLDKSKNFSEVLYSGLAGDGGLFVPKSTPMLNMQTLNQWRHLSYEELAVEIIALFSGDCFSRPELAEIVHDAYSGFQHELKSPLIKLEDNHHLLELFHGPTLAFKDFAMQVIAKMFAKTLPKKNLKINIITATSGDTGSAAVQAFKSVSSVNLYVLYPHERISEIQRMQMTTSNANNIKVFAVRGTFDDCQSIVKGLFADKDLVRDVNLSGVNSINWARILVQIVYYFSAFYQMKDLSGGKVSFSVPTGNFGDAYAGYLAKKMGLPINKIIVATNENDILDRVFKTGIYKSNSVSKTLSPSMDIQVASNFERLIYDFLNKDSNEVGKLMNNLANKGSFNVDKRIISQMSKDFDSGSVTDKDTVATINHFFNSREVILCPHSAIGVRVAQEFVNAGDTVISLGTAHPAKFKGTVESALDMSIPIPLALKDVIKKQENVKVISPDKELVAEEIRSSCLTAY
ncbi:threonine synthase [Paracoccaceae bacterium]|nr:threonine synthase [Paracoccaceae bacterium]